MTPDDLIESPGRPALSRLNTASLTVVAMVSFAANSLLCRLALGAEHIDPATFTGLRLLSGALTLWAIIVVTGHAAQARKGPGWISAALLFLYAAAFSFAYVRLNVGTGALILFGAVQATMIVAGLREGQRPDRLEWTGLCVALGGMAYLVSPGFPAGGSLGAWFGLGSAASNAQAPLGALLMALAGLAWGLYSLRGRAARDPLADTAASFARALPLALALSLVTLPAFEITARGACLAVISGGLASGLGYVVWYAALRGLTTTRAAIVQLCVPVLAAIGGVLLLSETVTPRLLVATVLVLGGISLAIAGRDTALRVRR